MKLFSFGMQFREHIMNVSTIREIFPLEVAKGGDVLSHRSVSRLCAFQVGSCTFLLDRDLQIEQVFVLEVYYQHIKEVTVRRCEVTERLYYQQVFKSYINCGTTLSVTVWT